jgi:GT2 family glycosyltransferase
MQLSIIIVNWNTRDLLDQCLASVDQTAGELGIELIVVDNASNDGSSQMVRDQYPKVKLVQNHENSGFARANNQGISESTGMYILLLNSDTVVKPGALQNLLEFMDVHPEAGAASACLLNADGSLQYSCSPAPSLSREVQRMLHFPGVRPDGYYPMGGWDRSQPREVEAILGACMLLRREVLSQVGLMDEDYFMYSEEVDLCYRIRQAGWRIYWVPQSQVIHFGGQSTRQASSEMFLRLYESKLIYFRKNYGPLNALAYKLLLMVSSLVRLSLVPLIWLEKPQKRRIHLALASNYQRLLINLPTL